MRFEVVDTVEALKASEWDALWPHEYPFTRHCFLRALERSNSVGGRSGWLSRHLIGFNRQTETLGLVMPMYLKTHSYGEYVFDWSWADAYAQHGLDYYPKLINAIPFTPATGPRVGLGEGSTPAATELREALQTLAKDSGVSGIHSLFPDVGSRSLLADTLPARREACQFHWFNRNYRDFDDFLQGFASRKRKTLRKEREKCRAFDIQLASADQFNDTDWQQFYQLYHRTYLKRSGRPGYLGPDFFLDLRDTMPKQLLLAKARYQGEFVAGAVFFRDTHTLYGRYWGAVDEFDGLHFETCYYQGIDYAIREGLQRFDPGAQGEHKIQRGFEPVITCSQHWLAEPAFHHAIDQFCQQEAAHNRLYMDEACALLPFKEGFETVGRGVLLGEINSLNGVNSTE